MRVLLFILLGTSPLSAQTWSCAFPALCIAGQSCTDAALVTTLHVAPDRSEASIFAFETDQAITPIDSDSGTFANDHMLLTVTPEGVATLSLHRPPARSYLGQCDLMQ